MCEVVDSGLPCPYQENQPTTAIQTTKFVPPNYLEEDKIYKYTMTLEATNEASDTGYDQITECSISLQTLEVDRFLPVELQLADEATLIGFLDPHASHIFFCGPSPG